MIMVVVKILIGFLILWFCLWLISRKNRYKKRLEVKDIKSSGKYQISKLKITNKTFIPINDLKIYTNNRDKLKIFGLEGKECLEIKELGPKESFEIEYFVYGSIVNLNIIFSWDRKGFFKNEKYSEEHYIN